MRNKMFVYVLIFFKNFKTVQKNNLQIQSWRQNKKAVLASTVYLKSLYSPTVT